MNRENNRNAQHIESMRDYSGPEQFAGIIATDMSPVEVSLSNPEQQTEPIPGFRTEDFEELKKHEQAFAASRRATPSHDLYES